MSESFERNPTIQPPEPPRSEGKSGKLIRNLVIGATASLSAADSPPPTYPQPETKAVRQEHAFQEARFSIQAEDPHRIEMVYNDEEASGTLTELGQLKTLVVRGRMFEYSTPIAREDVKGVVGNALEIANRLTERYSSEEFNLLGKGTVGGIRLEFSRVEGDDVKQYVVTPTDVLQITDQKPPIDTDGLRRLKQENDAMIRQYPLIGPGVNWRSYLNKFPEGERPAKKKEMLLANTKFAQNEENILRKEYIAESRVLVNEATHENVYEYSNPHQPNVFTRYYHTATGELYRSDEYEKNFLRTQTQFKPDGSQHTTRFHSNGRVARLTNYDATGKAIKGSTYNEAGIVTMRFDEVTRDVFNERGEPQYRVIEGFYEDEQSNTILLFDKEQNQYFDPLKETKESIRSRITTKEQYYLAEELLAAKMRNSKTPADVKLGMDLRAHGRELTGITTITKDLEEYCGVKPGSLLQFDTTVDGFQLCSTKRLEEVMPVINRELKHYPPAFWRNVGVAKIYIVAGSKQTGGAFGKEIIGYNYGEALLLSTDGTPTKNALITHHEVGHSVTNAYDPDLAKNDRWWLDLKDRSDEGATPLEKKPENFARAYGKENPFEDMATLAEALHSPVELRDLQGGAQGNEVLTQKIEKMKHMYYVLSEGHMDEQYWKDIERGEPIDTGYWQRRQEKGFVKDQAGERALDSRRIHQELISNAEQLKSKPKGVERDRALADHYRHALLTSAKDYHHVYYQGLYNVIDRESMEPKERIEQLEKTIMKQPGAPLYYYPALGKMYLQQNMPAKAVALYEQAQTLFPKNKEFFDRLKMDVEKPDK